jgi:hypothetical protein
MTDCSGSEVQVFLYLSRRIEGTVKGRNNGFDSVAVSQICHVSEGRTAQSSTEGRGYKSKRLWKPLVRLEAKGIVEREIGAAPVADRYKIDSRKGGRCVSRTSRNADS